MTVSESAWWQLCADDAARWADMPSVTQRPELREQFLKHADCFRERAREKAEEEAIERSKRAH